MHSGIVNIWHLPKQTRKQKKRIFFQKKSFLNEQGRKVYKYRFNKTLFPSSQNPFENNTKKVLSPLLENKNPFFQKEKNISMNRKKEFLEKKHSRETLLKQKSILRNRMWFFDTAAPIPGVSFLKKQKKFYREKMYAYKTLRNSLCIFNKKQRINFLNSSRFADQKNSLPKNWASFVQTESIMRRSLRKTGLVQNPKRRKSFLKYCVLNGKRRKKQNYVLSRSPKTVQKPADFCIFRSSKESPL